MTESEKAKRFKELHDDEKIRRCLNELENVMIESFYRAKRFKEGDSHFHADEWISLSEEMRLKHKVLKELYENSKK